MAATAPARRSGATRPAATTDPTPKKDPWQSEVTMRAASSTA